MKVMKKWKVLKCQFTISLKYLITGTILIGSKFFFGSTLKVKSIFKNEKNKNKK